MELSFNWPNVFCIQSLKDELNATSQQLAQLETHTEELEYDADALVNLIGVARATGKWEVGTKNG